jgi:hypothetical protein
MGIFQNLTTWFSKCFVSACTECFKDLEMLDAAVIFAGKSTQNAANVSAGLAAGLKLLA